MAGITIGMTRAQVQHAPGRPRRIRHLRNEFGAATELDYPNAIVVTMQGDTRVTAISTTGRHERTPSGVGVGSTRTQVVRLVPELRCETDAGFAHCFLGRFEPGRRVTDLVLKRGRVFRITVGVVID